MDPLALPLRVDERGWLVRANRRQVLVDLLRVMAQTPEGTWQPDPEFGLRTCFETPWRAGLPQRAIDALNRSLERMGMSDIRIAAIEKIPGASGSEASYAVTLVTPGRGPEVLKLEV